MAAEWRRSCEILWKMEERQAKTRKEGVHPLVLQVLMDVASGSRNATMLLDLLHNCTRAREIDPTHPLPSPPLSIFNLTNLPKVPQNLCLPALLAADRVASWRAAFTFWERLGGTDGSLPAHRACLRALSKSAEWEKAIRVVETLKGDAKGISLSLLPGIPRSRRWEEGLKTLRDFEAQRILSNSSGQPAWARVGVGVGRLHVLAGMGVRCGEAGSDLVDKIRRDMGGCGSTAWEYVHGGLDQRPGHARWCRYLEHFHHRSLMRAENGIFLTLKAIRNQSTRLGSGKLRVLPSDFIVEEIDREGKVVGVENSVGGESELEREGGEWEGEKEKGGGGGGGFDGAQGEGQIVLARAAVKKTLQKTADVIHAIAKQLKIPVDNVFVSGNKDSRAISTQYIVVRIPAKHVSMLKKLNIPNCVLGKFHRVNRTGGFGHNIGNRFSIIVRDILTNNSNSTPDKSISTCWDSVANESSFINYFGEQRFSMTGSEVGKAYIQRQYPKAIDLLLRNGPYRSKWSAMMLKAWRAGCVANKPAKLAAQDALKWVPDRHSFFQKRILRYFSEFLKDEFEGVRVGAGEMWERACRSAFLSLPWYSRQLASRAYLSRVWNFLATERILRYGLQVTHGDLLAIPMKKGPFSARRQTSTDQLKRENGPFFLVGKSEGGVLGLDVVIMEIRKKTCDKGLVCYDECCYNASISQLLLPLHGHQVKYPENAISMLAESYMRYDNTWDITTLEGSERTFLVEGGYRLVLGKASNFCLTPAAKLESDQEPHALNILPTNTEATQPPPAHQHHSSSPPNDVTPRSVTEVEDDDVTESDMLKTLGFSSFGSKRRRGGYGHRKDGRLRLRRRSEDVERKGGGLAAAVRFSLSSGQYATMFLRELFRSRIDEETGCNCPGGGISRARSEADWARLLNRPWDHDEH
ncbi:hypothetical protein AAMO2058_001594900 [Amorphochlora amoebiformis]